MGLRENGILIDDCFAVWQLLLMLRSIASRYIFVAYQAPLGVGNTELFLDSTVDTIGMVRFTVNLLLLLVTFFFVFLEPTFLTFLLTLGCHANALAGYLIWPLLGVADLLFFLPVDLPDFLGKGFG